MGSHFRRIEMEFSKKIQELRNKAQETQAANKIIDMLTQLKLKNDDTTSYRWIWELIQNAKDVVNSSGMVDIIINFNEGKGTIEFKHNGKLFTTENIVFLIEQVSTKDRTIIDSKSKRTTGKFGTGFLTTHLLSERVRVSGLLQDIGEKPCSFSVVLDRSGTDKSSIINAIQESCSQLDKSTIVNDETAIDENNFNTCFTYILDESGVLIAKKGLNNLIVSAPYVFAFVPEISSITVTSGQYAQKISRGEKIRTELDNAYVTRIIIETNSRRKDRYICILNTGDLSTAVEVEQRESYNFIAQFSDRLPRLFCDFPLLGTNDFTFPVVVNSPIFNPTEPRNGIYLTDKDHEQIAENKQLMMEASQLYVKMLNYFLQNGYKGIYNIVKIPEQAEKDWLSKVWFEENVLNKIKSCIREIPLVCTNSAELKPLFDEWGDPCVFVFKDSDKAVREKIWELSNELIPDMIINREESECWYNSLWTECHNYGLFDLVKRVEEFASIDDLSKNIRGNATKWLNELLVLIYANGNTFINSSDMNPRIFPNQHGDFCTINELYIDCGIDEIYKQISLNVDLDFKTRLLDKRISCKYLAAVKKLTLDDVFIELQKKLQGSHLAADDFYRSIICLQATQNEEQERFLGLVTTLYKDDLWKRNKVSKKSDVLLKAAIKFWTEKICKDISSCKGSKTFASEFRFINENESIVWLSDFVQYMVKYERDNLLDRIAILPNQYGTFMKSSELSLDSGEINEIIKDACEYAGYNIREILLLKDIYFNLPESRTIHLENISERITRFVKENKNSIGENDFKEKDVFRKVYLWLRENLNNEAVKKCFKDLLANLHWFYNDNDIAENMSKVEEYNDILKKYNVSGTQELEKILSRTDMKSSSKEAVEISKEFLAQWGISDEEDLNRALANNVIGPDFIHNSETDFEKFNYVKEILARSRKNIVEYLSKQPDYDVSDYIPINKSGTIFIVEKHKTQIYIIARPSDYGQIILYYDSELDVLDYEKDCELWVENGKSDPQKITFGKILKLTGVNKIPLRSIRENG